MRKTIKLTKRNSNLKSIIDNCNNFKTKYTLSKEYALISRNVIPF